MRPGCDLVFVRESVRAVRSVSRGAQCKWRTLVSKASRLTATVLALPALLAVVGVTPWCRPAVAGDGSQPVVAKPGNNALQAQLSDDLREGAVRKLLATQDRMILTGGRARARAVFSALRRETPGSLLAEFLYSRARGGSIGRTGMREALKQRLGLPAQLAPQVGFGWAALARVESDRGASKEALVCARYAAALTRSGSCYALLGWLARKAGEDDLARVSYTKAVRASPTLMRARQALLMILLEHREYESALRLARSTLVLTPRSAIAHLQWGMALSSAGSIERGRDAYLVALRLAKGDPDRVAAVAAALRRIEHAKLAEAGLEEALRAAPKHYGLLVGLAALRIGRGQLDEAVLLLERARRVRPKEASTLYLIGAAQQRRGKVRKAAKAYRAALKLAPDRIAYHLALGRIYQSTGAHAGALRVLKSAARQFPDSPAVASAFARALYEKRKYKAAADEYERAIELAPKDPAARFMLAVVLGGKLGLKEKAYRLLEEYEALGGLEPAALKWLEQLREVYGSKGAR